MRKIFLIILKFRKVQKIMIIVIVNLVLYNPIFQKKKGARKALKKGHSVRAIVTTKENKRLGTSNIVSIGKRCIKSTDNIYKLKQ